jgi:hypothetical protein
METESPTQVALAFPSPNEGGAGPAAQDGASKTGSAKNLMTILSVGAGLAYLFFGLFIVVLAGLYVFVRLR